MSINDFATELKKYIKIGSSVLMTSIVRCTKQREVLYFQEDHSEVLSHLHNEASGGHLGVTMALAKIWEKVSLDELRKLSDGAKFVYNRKRTTCKNRLGCCRSIPTFDGHGLHQQMNGSVRPTK